MSKAIPGRYYRHYRTKDIYLVNFLALDANNSHPVECELVVYQGLKSGQFFVRQKSEWESQVEDPDNGMNVERFQLLDEP